MIGFTLANDEYIELAQEAGENFTRYTGLPYFLLRVKDKKPHLNKLRLHDYLPQGQTGVFFDSDLFFVRDCDLSHLNEKKEFIAVSDPVCTNSEECIFVKDCRLHNINRQLFFNSGFYIWNSNHNEAIKKSFEYSQTLKVSDWGEQSVLNLAIQRSGCDINLIDYRYNSMYCFEHYKKDDELDSFAIHAAGLGGAQNKLNWLREQSKKYK